MIDKSDSYYELTHTELGLDLRIKLITINDTYIIAHKPYRGQLYGLGPSRIEKIENNNKCQISHRKTMKIKALI